MNTHIPFIKRTIIFVIWTSVLYIGYQLTNRYHLFTPHFLPLTSLDKKIPFLVWTTIPYLILVLGMYMPIFISKKKYFFRSLVALTIAVNINYLIFLFYPTQFARPPAPVETGFSEAMYLWLISIDTPANCFPSGHITSPGIGCWFYVAMYPKRKWIVWPVFTLLSLTVLTTKQHYIWDIFGGLMTMSLGIFFASRLKLFELKREEG